MAEKETGLNITQEVRDTVLQIVTGLTVEALHEQSTSLDQQFCSALFQQYC